MPDLSIPPITLPLGKAVAASGISRSQFYRCLAKGDIRAVKSGRSVLIDMASLRAYLASLPVAKFRAPPEISE
jgi:excisionase family DNA binding protein